MSVPPTVHTSVELVPHTALRSVVVTPVIDDHVAPLKRRTVPAAPTAQTSVALAHTPRSVCEVGLVIAVQVLQRRRRIVPASPTANTSLLSIAHTDAMRIEEAIGAVSVHHWPDGHDGAVSQVIASVAASVAASVPASLPPPSLPVPQSQLPRLSLASWAPELDPPQLISNPATAAARMRLKAAGTS